MSDEDRANEAGEEEEDGEFEDDVSEPESEAEQKEGSSLMCFIIIIVVFFILGLIDSFTTKYAKRGSLAFAKWTVENAPLSFLLYCFLIIVLVCACLPYGPLSLLMGAIFTQLYGFQWGITLGVIVLFITTMIAAVICFLLARHRFKEFVQRKINKSKKLKVFTTPSIVFRIGPSLSPTPLPCLRKSRCCETWIGSSWTGRASRWSSSFASPPSRRAPRSTSSAQPR